MKVRRITKSRPRIVEHDRATDAEREQFYADLVRGVREMKAGIVGRITCVPPCRSPDGYSC